jgi:hypothetical protein
MPSQWLPLTFSDFESLHASKLQYYQAVQYVAAIGRKYLEKSKYDESAILVWDSDQKLLKGNLIAAKSNFRVVMSISGFYMAIESDDGDIISECQLEGKTHRQVLVWLEEQMANMGLDSSQFVITPPYDLPDSFGKLSKTLTSGSEEAVRDLEFYFNNGDLILTEVKKAFRSADVRCWPKKMDITTRIIVNNTGNLDTSSYTTVGLSFGDKEIPHPYFYAAPWPYPSVADLPELSCGKWLNDQWVGAVLEAPVILAADDQYRLVRTFISECFGVLRKVMIY